MSTINVLCAPPNGRNPGMAAVDLAFGSLATELQVTPRYWRLWDASEWLEPVAGSHTEPDSEIFHDDLTGLFYEPLRGRLAEFLDADAIVFWGDFLHMNVYLQQTVDVLRRRMGLPSSQANRDVVARYLLLQSQDDATLSKTITFGTTLSLNGAEDYSDRYGQDLARFISGVRRAWFRDPYSAYVAQTFRRTSDSCQGVDATMLLPTPLSPGTAKAGVKVFVGRSNLRPEWVGTFGSHLAATLSLRPSWLPWGKAPTFWPMDARRRLRLAWPGLELESERPGFALAVNTRFHSLRHPLPQPPAPAFNELMDQISSARLVLTDTYHLAMNAWRVGTPAVCLVDQTTSHEWNVNYGRPDSERDKRRDLYSYLDVLPLLVNVTGNPITEANRVAAVLTAGQDLTAVGKHRLASAAAHAHNDLLGTLHDLLGSTPCTV